MNKDALHCIVDAAVPLAADVLAPFGRVTRLPAESIDNAVLADADALIIRSRTCVDADLLAGTRLTFVGSTVSGDDHLDAAAIAAHGAHLATAKGCNAVAVAEYVVAALARVLKKDSALQSLCAAVIGFGHVGQHVAAKLRALGLRVMINDPPRAAWDTGREYHALPECLSQADIVCLHTALHGGEHSSINLLNAAMVRRIKRGAVVLNCARGECVDEAALCDRDDLSLVIDCWRQEPDVSAALLRRARIATPHIAGHTQEAKLRGLHIIMAEFCAFFGLTDHFDWRGAYPPEQTLRIEPDPGSILSFLDVICTQTTPIEPVDHALRFGTASFNALRNAYVNRLEWSRYALRLPGSAPAVTQQLTALGFHCTGMSI